MSGLFVTFEGGEGAGKSTQIARLADYFRGQGRDVVLTREPGGTPGAEAVRELLVSGRVDAWSAVAEALLNTAARDSHLREVIRPALARNASVLCDRFMDSTRAYQGLAGGCPLELIDRLEHDVVGETRPEITFVFDLDPQIGLQRAKARSAGIEDRYERKGLAFHQVLRAGFLSIAKADVQRCIVVDASLPPDEVWKLILQGLKDRGHG
jgi:dTMP kinase